MSIHIGRPWVRVCTAPQGLDGTGVRLAKAPTTPLASGAITNHDEITVILIETPRRHASPRTGALAATPHNGRRHARPCCGGGDRQDHRRERDGTGTTQGGRTMSNDLKAFVISVGGLLAVGGSALLMLWVVVS